MSEQGIRPIEWDKHKISEDNYKQNKTNYILAASGIILKYMKLISGLNLPQKQELILAMDCAREELKSLIDLDTAWLYDRGAKEKSAYHYTLMALEELIKNQENGN